jgi:GNAT superfamily N-acetyltransferase
MTLRKAKLSDWSGIHNVANHLGYTKLTEIEIQRQIDPLIRSDEQLILVCEQNDQVYGWIHVLIARRVASLPFAEIVGLVVDPEHRLQGIGKSLVTSAEQWAALRQLQLRVRCNSLRQPALQFYQNLDFTPLKTQQVLQATIRTGASNADV